MYSIYTVSLKHNISTGKSVKNIDDNWKSKHVVVIDDKPAKTAVIMVIQISKGFPNFYIIHKYLHFIWFRNAWSKSIKKILMTVKTKSPKMYWGIRELPFLWQHSTATTIHSFILVDLHVENKYEISLEQIVQFN